ncbi:MarR family winged helix-turn-helix transcriptional regulator [Streptomyces sp. NPDC088747]|uniref:MarR family winged helix-turn-helix transcriptional regulator n=1 Tax=Streptomyces sp. NPDC088747 TaxID=3365886 RepID=UPI0038266FF7
MSDQQESAVTDLMRALMTFAYAMTRSQVHSALAATLDVKVERAGVSLLRALRKAEEPLRVGDIADRLLVRAPHVTRQAALLEREGLVERVRDPGDARVQLVRLTARGREVIDHMDAAILEQIRGVLKDEDLADIRTTARLLGRLSDDAGGEGGARG